MTHDDYREALVKLKDAPLTLTETDFQALESFSPADEQRARQVVRTKQLEITQTKAIAPPPAPIVSTAEVILEITKVLSYIKGRIEALERKDASQTASITELRHTLEELHALVQASTSDLVS